MRGRTGGLGSVAVVGRRAAVALVVLGLVAADAALVLSAPAVAALPAGVEGLAPLSAGGVNELTPGPIVGDFGLPGVAPVLPTPSAAGAPLPPSEPVTPVVGRPERVRELVGERSEFSSVWANADGSNTAVISPEPVHYRGPDGGWLQVDNRVVAQSGGVLGNAANAWSVRFGPLGAGGVGYRMASGTAFSIDPVGAAAGTVAVVDPADPDAVIYGNAWPGVDLRYVVHASGVSEDIVLHGNGAPAAFEFALTGGQVVPDPAGGGATGVGALAGVAIPAPEVFDGNGRPSGAVAAPLLAVPTVGAGGSGSRVVVSVDQGWLSGLAPSAFPVVIDPNVTFGETSNTAYKSDGYVCSPCDVRVGNPNQAGSTVFWRGSTTYDYSSLWGTEVRGAWIDLTWLSGSNTGQTVRAHWANAFSYAGAAARPAMGSTTIINTSASIDISGDMQYFVDTQQSVGFGFTGDEVANTYTYKNLNTVLSVVYNRPPNPPTLVAPADGSLQHTLTPTLQASGTDPDNFPGPLQYWFQVGTTSTPDTSTVWNSGWQSAPSVTMPGGLEPGRTYWWYAYTTDGGRASTRSSSAWSFRANAAPPGPTTAGASPADGAVVASTTPTLSVGALSDPEGDGALQYRFTVATGAGGTAGRVIDSGYQDSSSWTVPAGSLRDGVSYSWRAYTRDTLKQETQASWSWKVAVNLRLGVQSASPMDSAGAVSVNMANGNTVVAAGTPSLPAVGGSTGVTFTYNSQAQPIAGLVGRYYPGLQADYTIPAGAEPALVRVDPAVNFDWADQAPYPSVGADQFLVRWSGYVSVPETGSYTFGAIHDDGVRITVGSQQVLNSWILSAAGAVQWAPTAVTLTKGQPVPVTVEFFEQGGVARMQLWAHATGTPNPMDDGVVPSSWLTPDPQPLPAGWSMSTADGDAPYTSAFVETSSVTLFDTSGASHRWDWNGSTFTAPLGEQGSLVRASDGTLQVIDESGTSSRFDASGHLLDSTATVDDRHPAALANTWGQFGHLYTTTDPVSGRATRLQYGGNPNTGTTPCPTTAPTGLVVAPAGRLCQVKFWDGTDTVLWYYPNENLARIVDPGAETTDFGYDSAGILATVRDPLVNDAPSAATAGIPAAELVTTVAYSANRAAAVTAPRPSAGQARPSRTYTYGTGTGSVAVAGLPAPTRAVTVDADGRVLTDRDQAGLTTTMVWDPRDLLRSTTGPSGHQSITVYDTVSGRPTGTYGPAPATCFDNTPASATYLTPNGSCPGVASTSTRYDEGLTGLGATWFNPTTLTGGAVLHSTEPPSATWGINGPSSALDADGWSAVLTGEMTLPTAGTWTFDALVDGGARVWVDDQLAHDAWRGYKDAVPVDRPDLWYRLGEAPGATTAVDSTSPASNATYSNVTLGTGGPLENDGDTAATFNGSSSRVTTSGWTPPTNTFTLEAWVNPTATHEIDPQGPTGTGGVSGQRYLFWPDQSGSNAGIGVSVGTNGVSVYEHGDAHMPAVLVYPGVVTGWTHLAVTYQNKVPTLWLNGVAVATGSASTKTTVYAPTVFGGGWYGSYLGVADEIAVYPTTLSAEQVYNHFRAGRAAAATPLANLTAGRHRLRVDYANRVGGGSLEIGWTPPGGVRAAVPATAISPGYGLTTSAVDADGETTSTDYGTRPELGLAAATTVDPTDPDAGIELNLTSTTSYEPAGTGWFRRAARTLPAGAASGVTYTYWGDSEQVDNPCTTAADAVTQAGALRYATSADPDGTGPLVGLRHETINDSAGRVVAHQLRGHDSTTSAWECTTYDSRGRVIASTDRDGRTSSSDYSNPLAVVTTYQDSSGTTRTTTTESDLLGRRVGYTDELGTRHGFTYDQAGRPVDTTRALAAQPAGLLTHLDYDTAGRLSQTHDYGSGADQVTTFAYDPTTGRSTTTTLANGIVTTAAYDATTGAVGSLTHTQGAATVASASVTRAASGRITGDALSDSTGRTLTRGYSYDGAGRLTGATQAGTVASDTRAWAYDANSNRCARATSCVTATYRYDAADRAVESPEWSAFAHDKWGNVTSATPRDPGSTATATDSVAFAPGDSAHETILDVGRAGTLTATVAATATPTATRTTTGATPAGTTSNVPVVADGQSALTGDLTWTPGTGTVTTTPTGTATAASAALVPITTTSVGDLTADVAWAPSTTPWTATGTVAALGSTSHTLTATGNGPINLTLTWPKPLVNPDLALELWDSTGTTKLTEANQASGNSETLTYNVSGMSGYPTSRNYVVKVRAVTTGSGYTLSGSRPVTATAGARLINAAGATVATSTQVSGQARRTITAPALAAGAYRVEVTSTDFTAPFTVTETHWVNQLAALRLQWRRPDGTLAAEITDSDGAASLAGSATPSQAGSWNLRIINESPGIPMPSWTATASTTALADQVNTAQVPLLSQSVTHGVTADGPGPVRVALSWASGVPGYADLEVTVTRDATGATIASGRSATGALTVTGQLPAAGGYTVRVTSRNASTGTYTATTSRPVARAGVTVALVDAAGAAVTATTTGTNPRTLTATVTRGRYRLRTTPTGTGTATINATYPAARRELAVTYDGRDHATRIDDGTTITDETLDPGGRVLHRQVSSAISGDTAEDTWFGYVGPGDSPAYTRTGSPTGAVTTFGPGGATHRSGQPSTWPLSNPHGDLIATTDTTGAVAAVPLADPFGQPYAADPRDPTKTENRLGWLGTHQRYTTTPTSGIIRMGVRLYDPALGRFLEVDPVEGGSANDYDYVVGDPVNARDFSGTLMCVDGACNNTVVLHTKARPVVARPTAYCKGNTHDPGCAPRGLAGRISPGAHSSIGLKRTYGVHYTLANQGLPFKPWARTRLPSSESVITWTGRAVSCAAGGIAGFAIGALAFPLWPIGGPGSGAVAGCLGTVAAETGTTPWPGT